LFISYELAPGPLTAWGGPPSSTGRGGASRCIPRPAAAEAVRARALGGVREPIGVNLDPVVFCRILLAVWRFLIFNSRFSMLANTLAHAAPVAQPGPVTKPHSNRIDPAAAAALHSVWVRCFPGGRPRNKGGGPGHRPKAPAEVGSPDNGFAEVDAVRVRHNLSANQLRAQVSPPAPPLVAVLALLTCGSPTVVDPLPAGPACCRAGRSLPDDRCG
jgi:hypothetical protein